MKYKITNGLLLMWNGKDFFLEKQDLFISNSKIESIGIAKITDTIESYKTVDAENHLVMPGLINSHTHVYMNFMKNSADNLQFNDWLFKRILPIEAKMSKEDFYWTTLLGCIEMIETGTTSYLDMHICEEACAKAATESGMRAFLGKCLTGSNLYTDSAENFKKALDEKDKYESDLVKFVLSPHSIYTCSERLLTQVSHEAEKMNMIKHIHLSESQKELDDCFQKHRKTPVELLSYLGFLDNKTIAAHCVKINSNDIDILSKHSVSVATNPSSNAKLGNGAAPVPKMFEKKINVCLGTDSAASNNTLNMFRELNIFSLIHKAQNENAVDFTSNQALKSATLNPAKALLNSGKLGVISEGAFADLIFVNLKSSSLFPNNDILSSLCFSVNGSEVTSVMVNGAFLKKNGNLTTIDKERVYYEVNRIVNKYL